MNRFFHGIEESSAKLLVKYGRNGNGTTSDAPSFTQKVLFGAAKACTNGPSDPACYSVPQSPLPEDVYGFETDKHSEEMYNRPRFMASSMVMGHVSNLRPIYKHASEMLEFEEIGKRGSQHVFSQIFGEQEYARGIALASKPVAHPWRTWLEWALSKNEHSKIPPPNITLAANVNYEFGIGLDYFSSLFQVMDNSADDIRFVKFNHTSSIFSQSKFPPAAFKNPVHLPPDLDLAPAPYSQHVVSSPSPDPPVTALDDLQNGTSLWTDIDLATNIVVPGSSVPASLNFHGSELLLSELWAKMWYYPNARALLRQYIRSPDSPIAAEAAASGGDRWWDLRGGKGGVWTERGEWLEWSAVCGAFDDEVFGDGKGEFGREPESLGGQKLVFNAFGEIVSGKSREGGKGTLDGDGGLEVSGQELEKVRATGEASNENLGGHTEGEPGGDVKGGTRETKVEEHKQTTDESKHSESTEAATISGSETESPPKGENPNPLQPDTGASHSKPPKGEVKIEVSRPSPKEHPITPSKIETSNPAGGANINALAASHQPDTPVPTKDHNLESTNPSSPPDIPSEVNPDSPPPESASTNIAAEAEDGKPTEVEQQIANSEQQLPQTGEVAAKENVQVKSGVPADAPLPIVEDHPVDDVSGD